MPPTTTNAAAAAINKLVEQTDGLYSLPSVALEVLRLTESDTTDAAAIKQVIEGDPGLVVKVLKVVNSSLFGLSGEVGNLTQALALLGARPLKMLVLGFSLPDDLLTEASRDELDRFWRASLTRALVARDLAREHFDLPAGVSSDDAFTAGLLQELGVLVLLGQLGTPYAGLLESVAKEGVDPTEIEREALGFTRIELSAALARHWRLPQAITDAIASVAEDESEPASGLAAPLRIADLLVRLVVHRQLNVLPELFERCEADCGLTNQQVRAMVEPLEARVADLAEAMAAPLVGVEADNYMQTITDAQARLLLVTESEVADRSQVDDDELCESLLAESRELQLAMRQFLNNKPEDAARLLRAEGPHQPVPLAGSPEIDANERQRLSDALDKLARHARASRDALSVALVQVDADLNEQVVDRRLQGALATAGELLGERRTARLTLGPQLIALLLPTVGRGDAVAYVQEVHQAIDLSAGEGEAPQPLKARAGVASIEAVPNRFDVEKLIAAAEGCLASAKTSGPMRVRSIEVY